MKIETQCFYEMSIQSPDPRLDDKAYAEQRSDFIHLVDRLLGMRIPCKVYVPDVGGNYQVYEFTYHEDRKSAVNEIMTEVENQPSEGMGERFEEFVIPESCPTFRRKS